MSLTIAHSAGFFSCCSVKLSSIIQFINIQKRIPSDVDSSNLFSWYKKRHQSHDITYDYFEHYKGRTEVLDCGQEIPYTHEYQWKDYSQLNYRRIIPVVNRFFSPSAEIRYVVKAMERKYNLDYTNTCVLFYRGNDKSKETAVCGYHEYIDIAKRILQKNPTIQFLIQSDETEFIELTRETFPENAFYFPDEIRHISKCDSSVDKMMRDTNYLFSKYYLAITIIMSKCKYVACGSGNCSIWIMFYRGNAKNTCQNLMGVWHDNMDTSDKTYPEKAPRGDVQQVWDSEYQAQQNIAAMVERQERERNRKV